VVILPVVIKRFVPGDSAKGKAVTMQTLADDAGVSKMTVSLALRNSPLITPETRERVKAAARKWNYRPNPMVAALMAQMGGRKRSSCTVPLAVLDDPDHAPSLNRTEVLSPILQGIFERAEELGYSAGVFSISDGTSLKSGRLDKIFRTRNIRGIIVLPIYLRERSMDFSWEFYAAVKVGHSLLNPDLERVAVDDYGNMWLAMENIQRMGYRRPGLLLEASADARSGYQLSAAYERHIRLHPKLHACEIFPHMVGTEQTALRAWFKKWKPDVILSHTDHRPYLKCLAATSPGARKFVGVNWTSLDDETMAVRANFQMLGAAAVDTVSARMHRNEFGLPSHPRTSLVSGTWHQCSNPTKDEARS